ncbi:MAG: LuxR C-terminal-related transcriptional regulator [Bacteroidota bacterium]|nr:LuxR C-terminal-related transcriptional regulator [Bacteroidota bacterium]
MPKNDDAAGSLEKLLGTLLPPENVYIPVVTKEQQLKELDILNERISSESFYFVFNLLAFELENIKGVGKWLGYSEKEFTVNQYLKCIHPGHAVLFNMLAHSMYKLLCKGEFKLRFSTQRYISLVALKHYNGEYILFKKTTSVFQFDEKNRLMAQLNEFNKIELFDGSALKPRVTETEGVQKDDFESVVFKMVLNNLMEDKYFSKREFQVLQCYAANENITSKEVAKKLNVGDNTIDIYNKRILQKARKTFTHPFVNAREVAIRLKKEKLF